MAYENNDKKMESIYSKRIRAGKRRTYFFDVRATRGNDYYLTITESRKRFDDNGYDRHKIFLYKEDFNKFIKALGESVDYVKTELMPNFDFDAFNHDENPDEYNHNGASSNETVVNEEALVSGGTKENVEEVVAIEKEAGLEEVAATPVAETAVEVENVKGSTQEEVDKW
ncbi:MAG: DUF3276 family protein [Chitinophagaceae bacterium]